MAEKRAQLNSSKTEPRAIENQLDEDGLRAQGATLNTFEALVFFTAALTCCRFGNGHDLTAAVLCVIFLVARIIYPFFSSIMNQNKEIISKGNMLMNINKLIILNVFDCLFATNKNKKQKQKQKQKQKNKKTKKVKKSKKKKKKKKRRRNIGVEISE